MTAAPQSFQQMTTRWVWHYILGVGLFGFGCGLAFGIPGIFISLGAVIILGAFGQFLLGKIATMPGGSHD